VSRDNLGPLSSHGAAGEPRRRAHTPTHAPILGRLARPARAVVLATLGLVLGLLSIACNQQASQSATVPAPVAALAVVELAVPPEAPLAYAEISSLTPEPPSVSSAEPGADTVEAVALAADEPTVNQGELVEELRPRLSARGGLRSDEAALPAEQASPAAAAATQDMTVSTSVEAAPKAAAPRPTKTPTPKPAPAKAAMPRPVVTAAAYSSSLGQRVVSIALRYVGYRYRSGGTSPSTGFDCSGFVYFVFKTAGHPISRDIFAQYRTGIAVSRSSLKPGDRVYFKNTYRYGLSHASIYIGGGRIVHAQSESTGVTISSMYTSYWSSRYLGARRP